MLQQPSFGRHLRQLRTARGLSQSELAGDGMSTGYLSRLETGARRPTERAVTHLARRLGVTPADFTGSAAGSLADALTLAASTGADDAVEAVRRALADDAGADPALRWQARWLLARACRLAGDHAGERDHLVELVVLGDETGLVALRVRGLTRLARCLRSLGEIVPAVRTAATAHDLAHDLDVADRATALLALVSAETEAGRLPEADAHATELTGLVEGRTDTLWAEALWTAAAVRVRQGDHEGAWSILEDTLERFSGGEDLVLWARLRLAAGRLHLQRTPPRTTEAARCATAAASALAFVGTPALRRQLTALEAETAFHDGRHDHARALLGELAGTEDRMTYRDRARLHVLRNRLLVLAGDETGLQGLRTLARQARADGSLDLAAEVRGIVAALGDADRRAPAPPPPVTPPATRR
ncbi:helix-turn-helix domain-containing protein [Streptomyces sp. NPDC053750]|uniref:helix-turn-helix domain-containing protein n=1 Tax=Streptomyces sp. NPDC053750 TaxID=3365714 RepID=UPI0037D3CF3C